MQYWQRPSSRQMELHGFSAGDDYTQYTATMPIADATAYVGTEMARGTSSLYAGCAATMAQVTATTMAGGMMQVDTRLQPLYYTPLDDNTEEEEEEEVYFAVARRRTFEPRRIWMTSFVAGREPSGKRDFRVCPSKGSETQVLPWPAEKDQ